MDGTLVTHFKDGSFFGELEFLGIVDKVSQLTVTADTDCDLYSLRLGDIARALSEFPVSAQGRAPGALVSGVTRLCAAGSAREAQPVREDAQAGRHRHQAAEGV